MSAAIPGGLLKSIMHEGAAEITLFSGKNRNNFTKVYLPLIKGSADDAAGQAKAGQTGYIF